MVSWRNHQRLTTWKGSSVPYGTLATAIHYIYILAKPYPLAP